MTDTTAAFIAALDYWDQNPNQQPTEQEQALLLVDAEMARNATGREWGRLHNFLVHRCNLKKADAESAVKSTKIKAALGTYPYSEDEFIPAYLAMKGYTMSYNEDFVLPDGARRGMARLMDDLKIWTTAHGIFKTTYDSGLRVYADDQRVALARKAFWDLRHDPTIDPDHTELRRWLKLVIRPTGDVEIDERNFEAAVIAMRNFIHRVKNHIGAYGGIKGPGGKSRWFHYSHMMPVLYGAQEDGKTLAVRHLLGPLGDMFTGTGFEILEDNSKQYRLTYMPVMMFDELAGLKNANVEKLKGLMTEERRDIRQIYQAASSMIVLSTFIGCTNEDINALIKDKSGNRRTFQMTTQKIDVAAMHGIDALKIWLSVDEDETTAPMVASTEALEAVRSVQREQRHKSSVEIWIESCTTIPQAANEKDWITTSRLYTESYFPWLEDHFQSEARMSNVNRFGRELKRLYDHGHAQIEATSRNKSWKYRITPNNVLEMSDAVHRAKHLSDGAKGGLPGRF